jgi:antitoxin component YwqK of YwqJK toxin-antitoxin module
LNKKYGIVLSIASLFFLAPLDSATLWFVSNAAGQALKSAYSFTALREKFALSIMPVDPPMIPDEYRRFHTEGWAAECRTLYEKSALLRTQWVFIDENRTTRFVAAKSPEGNGFTEVYDEQGLLIEESRFDAPKDVENEDGSVTQTPATPQVIKYSYNGEFLTGARSDEWVDSYRYTRDNQIRAIDRRYLANNTRTRITMPRTPQIAGVPAKKGADEAPAPFISPAAAYTSAFLADVIMSAAEVTYKLDDKGRIVEETRRDEKGEPAGVLTNTWDGDRIAAIEWVNGADKRAIRYQYNGDHERVKEENYRDGVLERDVYVQGAVEIETLYLNGKPVLRATWENGRKVSEEPVETPRRTR